MVSDRFIPAGRPGAVPGRPPADPGDEAFPPGRSPLFPPATTYATGTLSVSARHTIYWEQVGNPAGVPVVFLHGGPGSCITPAYRRFFHPRHFRVVLFDQRGCGRSRPHASVQENTTWDLVADMEALRRHLGIDQWYVFGGSWGSTLALAYGESHPDRCLGFILRGIFLFRPQEVDWFLHGIRHFFPEAHAGFVGHLPPLERADPLAAYHKRLMNPDPSVHRPAARVWNAYEQACSRLVPRGPFQDYVGQRWDDGILAVARLECHYMMNLGFLTERPLLSGIEVLKRHPAVLVHGRYDMVCPPASAHELAEAWPEARLQIVPDAGHSVMEAGIARALVEATEAVRLGTFPG